MNINKFNSEGYCDPTAFGVTADYPHWFSRMCEYGFTEGKDFRTILSESTGGRPSTDHWLTIPMAKVNSYPVTAWDNFMRRNAVGGVW